ncbi:hypothetical protein [Aequorivita echinoideorum]|uniref:DUF4412 domain-containing protein n=1 Tax=Aequorivita echinoideorum TaxID=1549647 RepID=A0ABS5S2M5_9FLAO|nr:hypothetical protein [Aequorivita echinoideorum]MBT0606705.1 hypothetical protein [Aequorivita echinoideorum]
MKTFVKCIFIYFLLLSTAAQAQFFKKLKERVVNATENTVLNKSEKETTKNVDGAMDGALDFEKKESEKSVIPDRKFEFDYEYKMQLTTDGQSLPMVMYLKSNADYIGMVTKVDNSTVINVVDGKNELVYMFMDVSGQKMLHTTAIKNSGKNDEKIEDYTVTDLPQKTILGFPATGKQLENKTHRIILYYTQEAGVGNNAMAKSDKQYAPLKNYFNDNEDVLVLYVENMDKKKPKNSGTMEAISLKQNKVTLDTADYN